MIEKIMMGESRMRQKQISQVLKEKYGCKVYKLSVDAGFTCPNRDGTLGTKGCIFCLSGSGGFAERGADIKEQLEAAKARVEKKNKGGKYIAYFQAFTNTYGPIERLRSLYTEAMAQPEVVELSIATRPDCLSDEVVALLRELSQIKPITIELGLQTIHPQTARYIRRGFSLETYDQAMSRLAAAGIPAVVHMILGLPGESREMMIATADYIGKSGAAGIKLQLLHILEGTDLAIDFRAGKFKCLSLEEYGELLADCLATLPSSVVVHRLTGDGAKKDLIAPLWSADKKKVLNYLKKRLES